MAEYIEREALLTKLKERDLCLCVSESDIKDAPTADVAPVRHGRWGGEGDGFAETEVGEMALVVDVWYCSWCGYCIDEGIDDETLLPNYCPSCGCKMDKEVYDGD